MSAARSHILATIRTALGRDRISLEKRAELDSRLAAHKSHIIPSRGRGAHNDLIERFIVEARRVDATVERLPDLDAISRNIARFLATTNQGTRLKMAPDPALASLSWAGTALEAESGPATPSDRVGFSLAVAGIAETGTLMMRSGPESPIGLHFLPETAIVLLPTTRIVGAYEDAWALLRDQNEDAASLPRSVNLITGPSRTADIEQTLLLGAHGPMRLHILVIDDAGTL